MQLLLCPLLLDEQFSNSLTILSTAVRIDTSYTSVYYLLQFGLKNGQSMLGNVRAFSLIAAASRGNTTCSFVMEAYKDMTAAVTLD